MCWLAQACPSPQGQRKAVIFGGKSFHISLNLVSFVKLISKYFYLYLVKYSPFRRMFQIEAMELNVYKILCCVR
jgi:hypothetical protein